MVRGAAGRAAASNNPGAGVQDAGRAMRQTALR